MSSKVLKEVIIKQQRLIQKTQKGKIKFLLFTLSKSRLIRKWGLLGGKSQETFHDYTAINEGKTNALTPQQAAEADFNRIITRKKKEGYTAVDDFSDVSALEQEVALDLDNIPTGFCCSKPTQKTPTVKAMDKLIKHNKARFFVKYNGACHYILVNSAGDIYLFTRRWDDHTIKYPAIVEAINHAGIPPNTLLIAEFCIDPLLKLDHMTAQKHMSRIQKANTVKGICKSDQTKCYDRQKQYPVKAAVFGLLYRDSECMWPLPYREVYTALEQLINPLSSNEVLFLPQEAPFASGEVAIKMAKKYKKKLEGFVLWDMAQAMEVTMNGKPLRRASWKIKPDAEMDVIAYAGKEGKKPGLYGSLHIGRLDDKGEMVPMGTVGGLKPKEGETLPSYWNFPCVIEVTYSNIFPETGALQFGSFSKIHEDKQIHEVDLFSLD